MPDAERVGLQHSGVRSEEAQRLFARHPDFLRVAFVRNPWSRLYSWYCLLNQYQTLRPRRGCEFGEMVEDIRQEESRSDHAFRLNQIDYLTDRCGAWGVDWLGRFEHWETDVAAFYGEMGLERPPTVKLNQASQCDYRKAYSDTWRDRMEELCIRDSDMLGYDFNSTARVCGYIGKTGRDRLRMDSDEESHEP